MPALKCLFCLIFLAFACTSSFGQQPHKFRVDTNALMVVAPNQTIRFDVEIARSDSQRMAGLMYRTHFPKNRAMLFKFDRSQIIRMWMLNTPLPLDMLFLSETGEIVAITEKTTPYSRNIITSRVPATYAVELNAGVVENKKIRMGYKVIHPTICGTCGGQYR